MGGWGDCFVIQIDEGKVGREEAKRKFNSDKRAVFGSFHLVVIVGFVSSFFPSVSVRFDASAPSPSRPKSLIKCHARHANFSLSLALFYSMMSHQCALSVFHSHRCLSLSLTGSLQFSPFAPQRRGGVSCAFFVLIVLKKPKPALLMCRSICGLCGFGNPANLALGAETSTTKRSFFFLKKKTGKEADSFFYLF